MHTNRICSDRPCHLSRPALLAELRAYEAGIRDIERDAERLGADDPLLVDHAVRDAIWRQQARWITAVMEGSR